MITRTEVPGSSVWNDLQHDENERSCLSENITDASMSSPND